MNSVKLYSNGTAVVSREYALEGKEPLRITIPVKKSDLDDVISSISVFGDVRITEPPTYSPVNAEHSTLQIHSGSVTKDLITRLSGAEVEIEAGSTLKGTLVGLQSYRQKSDGLVIERYRVVISAESGIQQIEDTSLRSVRFTDPLVQSEIKKALQQNLASVKPESTTVTLSISANEGSQAAKLCYATPIAAWKIRYQLRITDSNAVLEGQAVVDNDSEDDWTNTEITVITGEPITFSTDLAEIRRPTRSRVKLVSDEAIGAVSVDSMMAEFNDESDSPVRFSKRLRSMAMGGAASASLEMQVEQESSEVHESGDFCQFTAATPVTIRTKQSAIIPLFRTAIGEASAVLIYKESEDSQRPFRGVRITNNTQHSLGRGVCEIYFDGEFQGKSVFEPLKQGEEAFLVHAKDTGVRVFKTLTPFEDRRIGIQLSDGAAICRDQHRRQTTYRIQNSHAEDFDFEIEHNRSFGSGKVTVSTSDGEVRRSETSRGYRLGVKLASKGVQEVVVLEEMTFSQQFSLGDSWLHDNLIRIKHPLSKEKSIQECIKLQKEVDNIQTEISTKDDLVKTATEEQTRLMKLIPNAHEDQAHEWKKDLGEAEKEIRNLKRIVLPELKDKLKAAKTAVRSALSKLQAEWTDSAVG